MEEKLRSCGTTCPLAKPAMGNSEPTLSDIAALHGQLNRCLKTCSSGDHLATMTGFWISVEPSLEACFLLRQNLFLKILATKNRHRLQATHRRQNPIGHRVRVRVTNPSESDRSRE